MSSPTFTTAVIEAGSTTCTNPASIRAAPTPPHKATTTAAQPTHRPRYARAVRALEQVEGWGPGAAAGVLANRAGRPAASTVGDPHRSHRWASVTKVCTALAALVAVEEGTVSLDTPAGPPGSTLAHLLAHASGLGPTGETVLAGPGTRRIYSNAGFEVVGRLIGERAKMGFDRYLAEAVLDPLGMTGARLAPGGSAAFGMEGTVADLMALASELLAPTVIDPGTLAIATSVAFPGLAGVLPGFGRQDPCDWGLGPEIRGEKNPHWTGRHNSGSTFGHFGRSGCFVWVDPEVSVACVAAGDREFGPWAALAWPALADAVLEEVGGERSC